VIDTARTTLASIRVMDAHGTVVLGRGDVGRSYLHLAEVAPVTIGQTRTVLRERGD
jgi:hypothetical protein